MAQWFFESEKETEHASIKNLFLAVIISTMVTACGCSERRANRSQAEVNKSHCVHVLVKNKGGAIKFALTLEGSTVKNTKIKFRKE